MLRDDLRFAVRLLSKQRGFALTAICVLGLGIGVNNMLFTILYAHTMRGLPIPDAVRVLDISSIDARRGPGNLSYPDFDELSRGLHGLTALAAFTTSPMSVSGGDGPAERVDGAHVTANAFGLIGLRPVIGRDFVPADDQPGAPAVALLGRGIWRTRYGGDPSILGRSILVNGAPATVIGVMPDRAGFPSTAVVWLPLHQAPSFRADARDARALSVFGRLRDGVTTEAARAAAEAIAARQSREHPDTNKELRIRVAPINDVYLGRPTDAVWLAFMTVGMLVALISCANVANLMLSRSVDRAREIAIRTSLGASRPRVVGQLLIEGIVLAACGSVAGLGVSVAGVRFFRSAIPANVLPYWLDYSMDARVVAALVGVSAATLLVFAVLPAIHTSKIDVTPALKNGERGTASSRAVRRWMTGFLAAEFALAVVMLAPAIVNFRVSQPDLPSDRAVYTTAIVTAAITPPDATYRTPQARADFYVRLQDRLQGVAGVTSVSIASALPGQGAPETPIAVDGHPPADATAQPAARTVGIGPRYFETLGLPLSRGREFSREDGGPGQRSAIVNERFAARFLAGRDPIGQRVSLTRNGPADWLTIVGVAPDVRQRPGNPDPIVYVPYLAAPSGTASLLARTSLLPAAAVAALRSESGALDPNLPLYRVQTLAQAIRDALWNGRVSRMLLSTLTLIAIGLSTVGLYAVAAHNVSQRSREIGVRMALGARPSQVLRLIARWAAAQVMWGFGAGILCTLLWDRLFFSGRQGLTAADPVSLAAIAGCLLVIAALACVVPARRAMRLDPVAAIRGD